MKKIKSKSLVLLSLFIALQIILTRFCSIQTPIVRIDLNFLAVSMCAILFGPLWGGIAAALADFIGVMLFPAAGAYFPGFTITTFFIGAVYGIFLYQHEISYKRIACAVVIISVFLSLGLDTLWLTMLTGKGFIALLPARLIKCVVMIPTQILLIRWFWQAIGHRLAAYTLTD